MILGTFLDPRYKLSLFSNTSDESSETALVNIRKKLVESYEMQHKAQQEIHKEEEVAAPGASGGAGGNDAEVENEKLGDSSSPADDLTDFDFESCYDQLVLQANSEDGNINSQTGSSQMSSDSNEPLLTSCTLVAINEIERYLSMGMQPREGNPLDWWRVNKNGFPFLSTLANKYLSAPPSSV